MFNKKKPNLETIQNLKNYFIKKYEIPESTILSIAELNCHEPDCPPTETVITARSIDGSTKNWKKLLIIVENFFLFHIIRYDE